mgnify:FL=1
MYIEDITEEQADWAIIFFTSLAHNVSESKIKEQQAEDMTRQLAINDSYTVKALTLLTNTPEFKC